MNVTKCMCDREFCNNANAQSVFLFKERKADGTGGSEDWHYKFDLCAGCLLVLVHEIFEHIRYKGSLDEVMALVLIKKLLIKWRVE